MYPASASCRPRQTFIAALVCGSCKGVLRGTAWVPSELADVAASGAVRRHTWQAEGAKQQITARRKTAARRVGKAIGARRARRGAFVGVI